MPEHDPTGWLAAHVFYDADLDPLITDVLPGLVEELRTSGITDDFFFLRYWNGGKHLRFRVRPRERADTAKARALVERRFRDHLTAHPAADLTDEAAYESSAATLAEREQLTGHLPRQPNNSVSFPPYHREHARYGYGATMAAVEQHFVESSELALSFLSSGPSPDQRLTSGYSAVMLAWLCCGDTPGDTTADDNLVTSPDAAYTRQREALLAMTTRLRALVDRVAHSAAQPGVPAGDLATLTASFLRLKAVLLREAEAGRFAPPERFPGSAAPPPRDTGASVQPVLDICAHLYCNRIGLLQPEESHIRGLAARALTETTREGDA